MPYLADWARAFSVSFFDFASWILLSKSCQRKIFSPSQVCW